MRPALAFLAVLFLSLLAWVARLAVSAPGGWFFAAVVGVCLIRLLLLVLAALFPGVGWRVAGPEAMPRLAKRAEAQYGAGLRAAGFQRLGSARQLFGGRLPMDLWVAPSLGVFATLCPRPLRGSTGPNQRTSGDVGALLCSYFQGGLSAVVTTNSREGKAPRRRPGYWRQGLEGEDIPGLLEGQRQLVAEYQRQSATPPQPWTDLTLQGRLEAQHTFESGAGRRDLAAEAFLFSAIFLSVAGLAIGIALLFPHFRA